MPLRPVRSAGSGFAEGISASRRSASKAGYASFASLTSLTRPTNPTDRQRAFSYIPEKAPPRPCPGLHSYHSLSTFQQSRLTQRQPKVSEHGGWPSTTYRVPLSHCTVIVPSPYPPNDSSPKPRTSWVIRGQGIRLK